MRKLLFALLLCTASMAQSAHAPDAIILEETGVATSYTAEKTITCDSIGWRVTWRSQPDEPRISGEVVVIVGEEGYFLNDAQEELFGRFSVINNVFASCNPASGDDPTRTRLLVLGTALETGTEALAQVAIEPDGDASWTFDIEVE